ncbi:MAG: ParB/RepB/Spo0J family partition protein [Pseudomonadota bacterium]
MSKKRGLGRGLDALLGGVDNVISDPVQAPQDSDDSMRMMPIEQIERGQYQPRKQFDQGALQELADSIARQGVIQPIVVRPVDAGYELIAGERRWRAAQLAGLFEIPVIVRKIDDSAAAAVALIENIQREDLNPLEEADALLRLQNEFNLTHQQVADAVGRSRAAVSNLLRLHELHDDVKTLVNDGQLDMGHARALLGLAAEQQPVAALRVVTQSLSVRATEALVKKLLQDAQHGGGAGDVKRGANDNPDIRNLEQQLGETLGARVSIAHSSSGKGRVEITYNSLDELDGILAHIK